MQSIEEGLLQAVKKDDKKAFGALVKTARADKCRLGRFPVLSLMYMYKSRRLISAYEGELLKISDYTELKEPAEILSAFSKIAGKCLRLYSSEVVSPLEMLLVLDKINRLKRVYPLAKPSAEVKERLKKIYSVKYSLNVKFDGDRIILDRRPLSFREKRNVALACLCSVLIVGVAVGAPLTALALIPKPVEGEVKKLGDIDFSSRQEYTLKNDISLPDNFSVDRVNCKIIGGGYKMIFGSGATLGELFGEVTDLTIESRGEAVFSSVTEGASVKNVTVNVNADVASSQGSALFVTSNYGTLDGVTLNAGGIINAVAPSTESVSELYFGGLVLNNSYIYGAQSIYRGVIKNCTANFSGLKLKGETGANASFGGVAGVNSGYVQSCAATGEINADTFDISGVCAVNNGMLTDSVNEAALSQTSANKDWNPITCGIASINSYTVENCKNTGKISSVSNCEKFEPQEGYEPTVAAAGIVYISRGTSSTSYIKNCSNAGEIESRAENRNSYAAGICISSDGGIENCKNTGSVTLNAGGDCGAYAGGITVLAYGSIYKAINAGDISAECAGEAIIGGISARSCSTFSYCFASGSMTVTSNGACVGGILGISEVATYGFYVYCGNAEFCVSEVKLNVASTGEIPTCVGGITGFVREAQFGGEDEKVYFGGFVSDCFFAGEGKAQGAYFGNIAGVVGADIYESNSFTSGGAEFSYFEGNVYTENEFTAFGAKITPDGNYSSADDKGAARSSLEEIKSSEKYKYILNESKGGNNG